MTERTIWGLHMGKQHGSRPIDEGYVAIGWARMGDLSKLAADREAFKAKLAEVYPDKKRGAIPVDAGTLFKFAYDMKPGDLVVYPSKNDRMINIGEIAGPYAFDPTGTEDFGPLFERSNVRPVRWLRSVPRTTFTQGALNEVGSAVTLFQVSTHAEEFLAVLHGEKVETEPGDDAETEETFERVEENTEDFVIRRLKAALSPERFEHFVAHLLSCMGYHARVTQLSGDGGIDIIAHRDELGFEPPVIKVQCKQVLSNIGRPDVQQLVGAVDHSEFGLFVTLGGYTREALDTERTRANLRLIDGPGLVDLIFEHYEEFEPQWQSVVPLKRRYIPGPVKIET